MSERPEFMIPDFLDGTTPEQLQERMMNDLPPDIDDMPGGFPYDMTMPTALIASELLNFHLVRALMVAFPQYAWGEWLDRHGENIHVYRHQPTYASGELQVIGEPGTELAAGKTFSTAATSEVSAIEFVSTETRVIGETGEIMVPIRAALEGKRSNVGPDTVVLQNKPLDGVVSVTNPKAITGGTEVETDDDYYARIQLANETENLSWIGNDSDYQRWSGSVHCRAGLGRPWDGKVSFG